MTNFEYIQSLKPREELSYEYLLAKALISPHYENNVDYDWDENSYISGHSEYWMTSDGTEFCIQSADDEKQAIDYEIGWLRQEHIDENIHVYCTNCVHYSPSENKSVNITVCPFEHRCCPLNFEDSMPFKDRPYYEEREEEKNDYK